MLSRTRDAKNSQIWRLGCSSCIGREYNSSTELYYNVYIRTECDIWKQDYYWR